MASKMQIHIAVIVAFYTLFLNQYTHCQFGDCGGDLSDQAGVITSPKFPSNYPDNSFCQWHITVADNQVISLRFSRLDLDRYNDQYCMDSVTFFDGPSQQYSRIGEIYCGYNNEEITLSILIRSTANTMTAVFQSDSSVSRTGFSASYRAFDCEPFTYGSETCDRNCSCIQANTDYCHNINGQCICNANWTGLDCSILVDHCQDPNICSDLYDRCVNIPGGYECRCKPGLAKNSTGQCEELQNCTQKQCSHYCGLTESNPPLETCYCPKGMKLTDATTCVDCSDWYYGDDCAYYTQCNPSRTESYNKTNGLCHCFLNWQSTYCNEDFDECRFLKQPCVLEKDHASCYNTLGSFECRCSPGYEPVNDTTCDECGKILTATSGTINSTTHRLADNKVSQDCNWTISAPVGRVISLRFLSINFYYYNWYWWCSANIHIFDGNTTDSTLIWRGTSWPSPNLIRTSGNEMLIVQYQDSCDHENNFIEFIASFWTHGIIFLLLTK